MSRRRNQSIVKLQRVGESSRGSSQKNPATGTGWKIAHIHPGRPAPLMNEVRSPPTSSCTVCMYSSRMAFPARSHFDLVALKVIEPYLHMSTVSC